MDAVNTNRRGLSYLFLVAGGLLLVGCGGPPKNNPMLDEARVAVQGAAADSAIAARAPDALEQAEASLRRGERLLSEGGERRDVEHYAYLTQQRIAIAQETARLKSLEEQIRRAELERTEVTLQARERESERARMEAEARSREADAARKEAEEALARARELTEKVQEMEMRETERGLMMTLSEVSFDVGHATLKEDGLRAVRQLATFLREYPERHILIEGHTDNTGGAATNLDLSRRRAEAIREALLNMGVDSRRIRTVGYGQDYPIADNRTAGGRAANRRVEVIISGPDGRITERSPATPPR